MPVRRFCLVLTFFVSSVFGQHTAAAPPAVAEHDLSATGPITFDVLVTDKSGHPVSGLQQSDFTVLDNRQATPIRSFVPHDVASAPNTPEGVFLLMDEVNTGFNNVSVERIQIENFLRKSGAHLPVPVSMAILTDTGIRQVGQPSTDGNVLANELQQEQSELRDLRRSSGFYGGVERLQISIDSLGRIAHFETRNDARKLLIWVSPGWWVFDNPNVVITEQQRRQIFSSIVDLSDTLRKAQITLYTIDPRGMNDAGSIYTFLWENYVKPVRKPTQSDPGDLALQVLSMQTGGKVYFGSNDVAGEIAHCIEDAKSWYSVTFTGERGDQPNTWHDIQVKVDKPGLIVRTRNGYYTAQ